MLATCSTLVAAVSATAAGGASPAGRQAAHVNVLAAVRGVLPRVERTSAVPIRIPRTILVFSRRRVYPTATASAAAYDVELGFSRGCAEATVCFAASFSGRRGRPVRGRQAVRLAGGIAGRFTPSSCGASCAPPEIQWIQQGVRYALQLYGRPGSDLATLIGYADSAITDPGL